MTPPADEPARLLAAHLANGSEDGRLLYRRFVAMLEAIGPFTVHPAKSTITFKGLRRRFCGAHPKGDRLIGYFDLMRAVTGDPRIRSVSPYTRRLQVHQFRVDHLGQLDAVFEGWLREAYAVGCGAHLEHRPPADAGRP